MKDDGSLQDRLDAAMAEAARLRAENARLRALLGLPEASPGTAAGAGSCRSFAVTRASGAEEKIALFRSLFQGRADVHAVRWETRKGRVGYSPACRNEWVRPLCKKPRVKCSDCRHQKLLPLSDTVVRDHLAGRHTVGLYPLLPNETCCLLVFDLDGPAWPDDAAALREACGALSLPAALERSRSGEGGHLWLFFDRPLPAAQARKLGAALVTRALDRGAEIGLSAYDRMIPGQDTLPRGGFGSPVALPLQRVPREEGNSLFLDEEGSPHPDQWAFLSSVRRVPVSAANEIVREADRAGRLVAARPSLTREEGEEDAWTRPVGTWVPAFPRLEGPLPERVRLVRSNRLYVDRQGLPSSLLNRLRALAAFQNPEFYRAQAMRLPTFDKPRVIGCAEDLPDRLALPRGTLEEVTALLEGQGIDVEVADERLAGHPLEASFRGELSPLQLRAAERMLAHDEGVLHATTAFGKTVVAAWLIGARGVSTLVLVHRRQLMDQWKERLETFLALPPDSVGRIGGGRNDPTGRIDIGMIQTLNRRGEVQPLVADYGHVIVDECHHVSAFSFEQVLKKARARFVLGLTATPVRKDGHHPIIMMQCGPIRFRVSGRRQAAARPFTHEVVPRRTRFRMPRGEEDPGIQEVYRALIADAGRNDLILDDVLVSLEEGRSPLILTERTEHLETLAGRLKRFARNLVVLRGGMGKKQREAVFERLRAIPDGEERVLVATGRYIGEGFDDARLDTLFLAMPISWRGTLQQYAGRLHRLHARKRAVRIFDYVDARVPMLARMYERRLAGYRAMGYEVEGAPAPREGPP